MTGKPRNPTMSTEYADGLYARGRRQLNEAAQLRMVRMSTPSLDTDHLQRQIDGFITRGNRLIQKSARLLQRLKKKDQQ